MRLSNIRAAILTPTGAVGNRDYYISYYLNCTGIGGERKSGHAVIKEPAGQGYRLESCGVRPKAGMPASPLVRSLCQWQQQAVKLTERFPLFLIAGMVRRIRLMYLLQWQRGQQF